MKKIIEKLKIKPWFLILGVMLWALTAFFVVYDSVAESHITGEPVREVAMGRAGYGVKDVYAYDPNWPIASMYIDYFKDFDGGGDEVRLAETLIDPIKGTETAINGVEELYNTASKEIKDYVGKKMTAVAKDTMMIFWWIFFKLGQIIIGLEVLIINLCIWVVAIIFSFDKYLNVPAVSVGWVAVRDLCNSVLVLVMIMIGIGTILNLPKYSYKQLLVKVLVAAVLVNFSKMIAGIFIDIAQVIMLSFFKSIEGTFAQGMASVLGIKSLDLGSGGGAQKIEGAETLGAAALALGGMVTNLVAMAIFAFIMLGVMIIYMVVLVIRLVMIWLLVVLSPMPYVITLVPRGEGYAQKWWTEFINYIMLGPLLAFFLWLSLMSVSSNKDIFSKKGGGPTAENIQNAGSFKSIGLLQGQQFFTFVVSITLLLGGLTLSQSIAGVASGAMSKGKGKIFSGLKGGAKLAWKGAKGSAKLGLAVGGTALGGAAFGIGKLLQKGTGGKVGKGLEKYGGIAADAGLGHLKRKAVDTGGLAVKGMDYAKLAWRNMVGDQARKADTQKEYESLQKRQISPELAKKRAEKRAKKGMFDAKTRALAKLAQEGGEKLNVDTIKGLKEKGGTFGGKITGAEQSELMDEVKKTGNLAGMLEAGSMKELAEMNIKGEITHSRLSADDIQNSPELVNKALAGLEGKERDNALDSMMSTKAKKAALSNSLGQLHQASLDPTSAEATEMGVNAADTEQLKNDLIRAGNYRQAYTLDDNGLIDMDGAKKDFGKLKPREVEDLMTADNLGPELEAAFASAIDESQMGVLVGDELKKALSMIAQYNPDKLNSLEGKKFTERRKGEARGSVDENKPNSFDGVKINRGNVKALSDEEYNKKKEKLEKEREEEINEYNKGQAKKNKGTWTEGRHTIYYGEEQLKNRKKITDQYKEKIEKLKKPTDEDILKGEDQYVQHIKDKNKKTAENAVTAKQEKATAQMTGGERKEAVKANVDINNHIQQVIKGKFTFDNKGNLDKEPFKKMKLLGLQSLAKKISKQAKSILDNTSSGAQAGMFEQRSLQKNLKEAQLSNNPQQLQAAIIASVEKSLPDMKKIKNIINNG